MTTPDGRFENEAEAIAFTNALIAGDIPALTDEELEANYQRRLADGHVAVSPFTYRPDVPGARLSPDEQRALDARLAAIDEAMRLGKAGAVTYFIGR